MIRYSSLPLTIVVLFSLISNCEAQHKKPFSQLGFDKGESDYLKSKPVKGDKITEILKAFSETSEPKKTESTNLETEAQATPTPKQTLPPARTRKTLSQID